MIKTGTEYDTELAKEDTPCQVKIGGMTAKFVPNINASKWNDECWLNINHPDIVNTEKEQFTDGKVEISVGDNTHRYYVDPRGRLEYEIVLAKKPALNKIILDLDFPIGLVFYYQDTLENDYKKSSGGAVTLQEYLATHNRPDEVVGSYAAYWNRRNNQYKTGKFVHIYRPKVIDKDGKEAWCDQFIMGKKWTIEIDQSWLDKAVYPVVIDPDLGYSTEGGSTDQSSSGIGRGGHDTTDGTGGDTVQLHAWCANGSGSTGNFKICLYSDNGLTNEAAEPVTQLLAEVEVEVLHTFDGQKNVNYVTAVAASTKFWVVWLNETSGTLTMNYDTSGDAYMHSWQAMAGYDMPVTWPSGHSYNETQWSIWADYAPAGDVGLSMPLSYYYRRRRRM